MIETGRPIPEVADELGVHSGTLHSWVSRWRRNGSASSGLPAPAAAGGRLRDTERAELERLRREIIPSSVCPGRGRRRGRGLTPGPPTASMACWRRSQDPVLGGTKRPVGNWSRREDTARFCPADHVRSQMMVAATVTVPR
ncbi:transposase [Streptomyces mirabilis]